MNLDSKMVAQLVDRAIFQGRYEDVRDFVSAGYVPTAADIKSALEKCISRAERYENELHRLNVLNAKPDSELGLGDLVQRSLDKFIPTSIPGKFEFLSSKFVLASIAEAVVSGREDGFDLIKAALAITAEHKDSRSLLSIDEVLDTARSVRTGVGLPGAREIRTALNIGLGV